MLAEGLQAVVIMEDGGYVILVRTRRVVFSFVPSVTGVGVRKRAGSSRVLSDAEMHLFISQWSAGGA